MIQDTGCFEDSKSQFNPWAVTDVSVFLKYCCPECEFNDPILQYFADHSLTHHPNSSSLFIDENSIELIECSSSGEDVSVNAVVIQRN